MHGWRIYNNGAKAIQWENEVFSTHPVRTIECLYANKHTLTLPHVKMNLKIITDPNVKLQITKRAEENIKENAL